MNLTTSRLVYAGHFTAAMPWYARDEEQDLPQRCHGRIEYDAEPAYRIVFYGTEIDRSDRLEEPGLRKQLEKVAG